MPEEAVALGETLKLVYFPANGTFNLVYKGRVLLRSAHFDVLAEGRSLWGELRVEGYRVGREEWAGISWHVIRVNFTGPSIRVTQVVAVSSKGLLITYLTLAPARRMRFRMAAPLSFAMSPQVLGDVVSKEFWTLPGHYVYGLRDRMYLPLAMRLKELNASLLVASLTSELCKFWAGVRRGEDVVWLTVYSMLEDDRLEVLGGHELVLDKLLLAVGRDVVSLLEEYARLIAAFNKPVRPRRVDDFPLRYRGWISWAYYYTRINPLSFKQEVDFIYERLRPLGYRYVILDDGWERRDTSYPAAYDWVETSEAFQGGLEELIGYAHERGIRVILWVAFTAFDGNSYLVRERPEMFLQSGGSVYVDDRGRAYLNITSTAAREYIEELFRTYRQWGVDGLTFDLGTIACALPLTLRLSSSKNLTLVALTNSLYSLLDELAAKYGLTILVKGSPELPLLAKYRNILGVRISWDVTYGSVARQDLVMAFADAFLKTSFWLAHITAPDPDALITGDGFSEFSTAVWNALECEGGAVMYYGDPWQRANVRRLAVYQLYKRPAAPAPEGWWGRPPPLAWTESSIAGYRVVAVLLVNGGREEALYEVNLTQLGLEPPVVALNVVEGGAQIINETTWTVRLGPASAALLHLSELEGGVAPLLAGWDPGAVESITVEGDEVRIALAGEPGSAVVLELYVGREVLGAWFQDSALPRVNALKPPEPCYAVSGGVLTVVAPARGVLRVRLGARLASEAATPQSPLRVYLEALLIAAILSILALSAVLGGGRRGRR